MLLMPTLGLLLLLLLLLMRKLHIPPPVVNFIPHGAVAESVGPHAVYHRAPGGISFSCSILLVLL